MVIGIFGESCTGKSTLADRLKALLGAEVYTGKDYLRRAKNEAIAQKLFQRELDAAMSSGHVIYVISEPKHLRLLPEKALRVLVTSDLDTIKQRFAQRMRGNLPVPVAAMLEKKHGLFDSEAYDIHVVSDSCNLDCVCKEIQTILEVRGSLPHAAE